MATASTVGYCLWMAGLAGVTVASALSWSRLFWLSFTVFALGGAVRGVVAMWRWQNQPTSSEADSGRLDES